MTALASPFQYAEGPDSVRTDLVEANRRAWEHLGAPGTWLTAAERVAVVGEDYAALF